MTWGLSALLLLADAASFSQLCLPCHGVGGRGDGPAAHLYQPPPADLTGPLKFGSIHRSIRHGVPGTGMPAFDTLSQAEVIALVDEVERLRGGGASPVQRDWWPSRPLPESADRIDSPLPILADASADQCGRCHPTIFAQWRSSRHGQAAGPGVVGQYVGRGPAFRARCNACHAPLAAQQVDAARGARGVTCAGCHVRDGKKAGPGNGRSRSDAPGLTAAVEPRFRRADFCLPCHNQAPSAALDGRPLLDTWREWAASPYLPAGVQCQHCHQPDGRHDVLGAHDPSTVARAVRLSARFVGETVEVRLRNVGAGHHFPTTATPRGVIEVQQRAGDRVLSGTVGRWAVGRTVEFAEGRWREVADTRVPAGGERRWVYAVPLDPGTTAVEVGLFFFPDWYYGRLFRQWRDAPGVPAAARAAYAEAERAAEASGHRVHRVRLERRGPP